LYFSIQDPWLDQNISLIGVMASRKYDNKLKV
jgi:hypothetical protein